MKYFVETNNKNKWFTKIDYEEYNRNCAIIKSGMFYTNQNDTHEQIPKCSIFFN